MEGDTLTPVMRWDDVPSNLKQSFEQARHEFTRLGSAESKACKIESLEIMLMNAQDKQDELGLYWGTESNYYMNANRIKCKKNRIHSILHVSKLRHIFRSKYCSQN